MLDDRVGSAATNTWALNPILSSRSPNELRNVVTFCHVVSFVPDAPPGLWRRYLAIIIDGLRPDGAHELP